MLSIQDDEGYKRLAKRLAGLDVLMYMGPPPSLVKNSLGPAPGSVPDSGAYSYRGRSFRVFTLHAKAFPSGPLRITVLIPIPYLGARLTQAGASDVSASRQRLASSSSKEAANFSTPSRSSVSVTSS